MYSPYFPPLQYNATQGAFFGGNFWDSHASGESTAVTGRAQSAHAFDLGRMNPMQLKRGLELLRAWVRIGTAVLISTYDCEQL
jgi:hypothetical protein